MSGGHFDYQEYRIEDIARDIDRLIESNDDDRTDEYGYTIGRHYPPEIIAKFRETAALLRRAASMAHRIDYLVCGDDSEETFLKRWKENENV